MLLLIFNGNPEPRRMSPVICVEVDGVEVWVAKSNRLH